MDYLIEELIGRIMGYVFLICFIGLVFNAVTASKFETIANMKGHYGYFWWCFLLGAIGWAMVIALPDRKIEIPDILNAPANTYAPTNTYTPTPTNTYESSVKEDDEEDDSLPDL